MVGGEVGDRLDCMRIAFKARTHEPVLGDPPLAQRAMFGALSRGHAVGRPMFGAPVARHRAGRPAAITASASAQRHYSVTVRNPTTFPSWSRCTTASVLEGSSATLTVSGTGGFLSCPTF